MLQREAIHAVSLLRVQAEALEAAKAEGKDTGADLVLYKRMAQVLAGGGASVRLECQNLLLWGATPAFCGGRRA